MKRKNLISLLIFMVVTIFLASINLTLGLIFLFFAPIIIFVYKNLDKLRSEPDPFRGFYNNHDDEDDEDRRY
jgi:Ca2+/Na+ antiporter|tara:strand:+ start:910 stop:1125 length:216 start_codon:yes stop_codon:yes gene_type:complete